MRVSLQESRADEFRDMPVTELVRKSLDGLLAAIERETGLPREDLLRKGMLRGGELEVTAELSDKMTRLHSRRMKRLAEDLERAMDAHGREA